MEGIGGGQVGVFESDYVPEWMEEMGGVACWSEEEGDRGEGRGAGFLGDALAGAFVPCLPVLSLTVDTGVEFSVSEAARTSSRGSRREPTCSNCERRSISSVLEVGYAAEYSLHLTTL